MKLHYSAIFIPLRNIHHFYFGQWYVELNKYIIIEEKVKIAFKCIELYMLTSRLDINYWS